MATYVKASELLPEKLLLKCLDALGDTPTKISFAAGDQLPNESESKLPPELAAKVRRWLDASDYTSRVVYFQPARAARKHAKRPKVGRPQYAGYLSKAGIRTGAIVVALGITYPTASKYGATRDDARIDWEKVPEEKFKRYVEEGQARVRELGIEKSRNATGFYANVGCALTLIRKNAEKWDAEIDLA